MAGMSIIAKLGLDGSKFSRGLKSIKGKLKSFGSAIGTVVKAGALAAGAAITAFAVKGIADFIEFDKGMREVFTLLPDATEQMKEQMMADVRALAAGMGVDLKDAVNALYQAISAGIPAGNGIEFLTTATKLAVGGVSSLETATTALTTVLNGYGLEAGEAGRMSDILFTVVKNGTVTLDELGANIGKITPVASDLGVSFEEVGAMFAVMTKKLGSGKAAEAGTQVRAMLNELGKAGTRANKAFMDIAGMGFRDFLAKGGTVTEALQMMTTHAQKNGLSLNDMFSSIEAGNAALALSANGAQELVGQLENMNNSAGATERAFAEMEQSVSRQWEKLMSSVTELGLTMGAAFEPFIKKVLPLFIGAVNMLGPAFNAGSGPVNAFSDVLDGLLRVVNIVLKTILMLVNTLGMWGDILTFIGKQIATFVNVLTDFAKGALDPLIDALKAVGKAFSAMGDILANPAKAQEGLKKLKEASKEMGEAMEGFGDAFVEAWDKNLDQFNRNNAEFVKNMANRGKMFMKVWEMNLAAAAKAEKANDAAVNPLVKGHAAAQGINQGLQGARQQGGPLAERLKLVQARLEGCKKWAEKCKQAQEQWNAAAKAAKDFYKETSDILEKILKNEKLTRFEKDEYLKILKKQKELEQDMNDVTREGYNELVKQKEQIELMMADEQVRIKNLPALSALYEEIKQRIKEANDNMQNGAFFAKMMANQAINNRDAWAEVAPAAEALRDVIEEIAALESEIELLKLDEAAPARMNEVNAKLEVAKAKQKELNEIAKDHPGFKNGEFNPEAADFQVFHDMDKKLGEINTKLGGFFVNQ